MFENITQFKSPLIVFFSLQVWLGDIRLKNHIWLIKYSSQCCVSTIMISTWELVGIDVRSYVRLCWFPKNFQIKPTYKLHHKFSLWFPTYKRNSWRNLASSVCFKWNILFIVLYDSSSEISFWIYSSLFFFQQISDTLNHKLGF